MKEKFNDSKGRGGPQDNNIERINIIIEEYAAKGIYCLSMRQLYYQFVSRNWLENKPSSVVAVENAAKHGRLRGQIDWEAIEDRGRNIIELPTWEDPSDRIQSVTSNYHEDYWITQEYRPEVWIEKQALVSLLEEIVCDEYHAPLYTCRGYDSLSQIYQTGKRFAKYFEQGYTPLILYLGDHDPSGVDISESDIRKRVSLFAGQPVEIRRLALNFDQTAGLPPNEVKLADSKASKYIAQYGYECWELDALPPEQLVDLVRQGLENLIHRAAWDAAVQREEVNRETLRQMAENL